MARRWLAPLAGILLVNCGLLAGIDDFKGVVDDEAGSSVAVDSSVVGETSVPSGFDASAGDVVGAIDAAVMDSPDFDASCEGAKQGAQLGGDPLFRCCNGKPTRVDTNDNCGVCGFVCKTDAGISCQGRDGHMFCAGCAANWGSGFSLICNLGCCDKNTYGDGVCVPDALCIPHACAPGLCSPYGAMCSPVDAAVSYCTYE